MMLNKFNILYESYVDEFSSNSNKFKYMLLDRLKSDCEYFLGAGNGYSVGATGGEATHTLTIGEMPSHSHSISYDRNGGTNQVTSADFSGSKYTKTTSTVGGGAAHNNMPPYYALCYIQRIA